MAGTSPAMTDGGWNVRAKQRFIASAGHDGRMLATLRRRSGNSVIDLLTSPLVMPGLVPGMHVLGPATKDVDGRDVGAKQSFVARPAMTRPSVCRRR